MSDTKKRNDMFLTEVANQLLDKYSDRLGDCTVVFPNRRAGLFLKKALSSQVEKPIWSPHTVSLEDFLFSFSSIHKSDSLTLIFELFEAFKMHQGKDEGFEHFYFWGEMLLRDFEEVDHYLVNPEQLFSYVRDDRQLADDFYFLDEEQERIIQKFWQEFLPTSTKTQEQFVETWKILLPVYQAFKQRIVEKGIGYTSHVYRSLQEDTSSINHTTDKPLIFAGFNALTPVEEFLIKHFVTHHQAEVLWDVDDYYLSRKEQEAGTFLRKYASDPVLASTFPKEIKNRVNTKKIIHATGVSLEVGQAKLIGQEVDALLKSGVKNEEIVIVLPQDYMLFPVLNALPPAVDKLNVTMGYPLKDTPLYGLLEAALDLQEHVTLSPDNGLSFYHKPTMDILNHPYLYKEEKGSLDQLITTIRKKNQIRIFQSEIQALQSSLLNRIFYQVGEQQSLADYLEGIIIALAEQVVERFGLEREYLYHFHQLVSRLGQLLASQPVSLDIKTFKNLFRKTARSVKIPFSGEPVEGLQVMGVLETRNLDFKHVLMLNMNEGIFPTAQRQGSFIPYRIRKGFDLPTFETQDAIYAYLFYRLFHRAEKLDFYYNMVADFGMSGEVSRFLRQIELESAHTIQWKKLYNSVEVKEVTPISIPTTRNVLQRLACYTDGVPPRDQKKLTASALNIYMDCRLKFYFRYVLRLFSKDEMNDQLDARHFGNVLHKTLEYLYQDTIRQKASRMIDANDFLRLEASIDGAMEKAFKHEFGMKERKRFEFKDRNAVMSEIIRRFVLKVLEMDRSYAPFEMVSMEAEDKYVRFVEIQCAERQLHVKMGADIDRVDKKDGVVRVLDYKTGRDETEIGSVENIFNANLSNATHRAARKAAYQTFFYAWLYASKYGEEDMIVPGLVNINQFFKEDFDYRLKTIGTPISDARVYLTMFQERLVNQLEEIFNPDVPFDQTENEKKCIYCEYRLMCER